MAGAERGRHSDLLCYRCHKGQQRNGVMFWRLNCISQRRIELAGIGVGDVVQVGEEHHVEQAAFTCLSDLLVQLGTGPGIGLPLC